MGDSKIPTAVKQDYMVSATLAVAGILRGFKSTREKGLE